MQPALCLGLPFEHCNYLEWVKGVGEVVGGSLLMVHEALLWHSNSWCRCATFNAMFYI